MKLKDLNVGDKFMFVNNDVLTDIYVLKYILKNYYVVGLPHIYDEFAAFPETEVIAVK